MAHKRTAAPVVSRLHRSNGNLGLPGHDVLGAMRAIQAGLSYAQLIKFVAKSGISLTEAAQVMRIPPRTLARRKAQGALSDLESERLVRLAGLFDQAEQLFEGDAAAAARWLRNPAKALGNHAPLELATTEIGARAVEDLIGRLEFGVYS